ncbi:MBL fold metallo-hydrolase [Bacillus tianshenii]|nr:MBL fold metallo-hydrolase [Bacillus tianshenii]
MKWEQLPLGPLQTNAYIVWNDNNEAVVIDPGGEAEKLFQWLDERSLQVKAVLLTHAHFDHIGAVDEVRERFNVPVYLHKNEKDWLMDPASNGSEFFLLSKSITAKPADQLFEGEQALTISSFEFEVLETPGHSPGSVSFYVKDANVVFAGDTLFARSIGRTDLPGGSHKVLIDSIHDKLLSLPESTTVAPGHGPTTTVQSEMDGNPFLHGF